MALEYISMANSFNVPQKGGNICGKFVSTQNSRNAIYNNVSMDLTPLNRQQQKLAGAFENVVTGVAKALEETNTGWTIDAEFKEGENIKPITEWSTIESETLASGTETWNYTNEVTETARTFSLVFSNDYQDNNYYIGCNKATMTFAHGLLIKDPYIPKGSQMSFD